MFGSHNFCLEKKLHKIFFVSFGQKMEIFSRTPSRNPKNVATNTQTLKNFL